MFQTERPGWREVLCTLQFTKYSKDTQGVGLLQSYCTLWEPPTNIVSSPTLTTPKRVK